MKFIPFIFCLALLYSCDDKTCIQYNQTSYQFDGIQRKCLKSPELVFDVNPVELGGSIDARIYSKEGGVQIVKAYIDSNLSAPFLIDTLKKEILGAKMNLHMDNDTIRIYFKPKKKGEFDFIRTKILFFQRNQGFGVIDTSFKYKVI